MDAIPRFVTETMGLTWAYVPSIVAALFALAVAWALGAVAARTVGRVAGDGPRSRHGVFLLQRLLRLAFGLVGIVLALQFLGLTAVATSLLATGGIVAVVLGFAFREIGENLLAGLFLAVSRSFEVGDLIESSDQVGHVKDIQLRHVHLRTGDGRDVFIPSSSILSNVLVNFTRDHLRRGEFTIGVDYATDLREATRRLLAVVQAAPGVLAEPAPDVRVEGFEDQYVALRALFWVNTEQGTGLATVRSAAMQEALDALRELGVAVSADVTSGVVLAPVDVRMSKSDA